ncbi:acyltransferase [Alteromonas sp. 14N.309.X.WAT.G.H12]|uniref:acyltransferase family protein n=1 Tax=Alteromonas sp. 14N.309.X.WAT.G.H12 TaxID=3120824 RepID=UPI002FD27ADB
MINNTLRQRTSQLLPAASPGHVTVLDGWRGCAVGFVLISHFFNIKALSLGSLGVNFFFALSGLLMANILFVKRVPLLAFYQHRLARVFPVFLVFVTGLYSIGGLLHSQESTHYLATITFLRSYIGDVGIWQADLPIGHLWSLNVEEHAYLLLGGLALFVRSRRFAGLLLITIGALSIATSLYYQLHESQYLLLHPSLHQRTEANLACLMFAGGYGLNKVSLKSRFHFLPILTLICGILCYSDFAPWHAPITLSPCFFAFSVVHLNETSLWAKNIFNFPPLRLLGLWSFSLYLWQQPFYHIVIDMEFNLVYSIAGLLLSFCVGVLSFYYLERPLRRVINNIDIKRHFFR